MRVSKSTVIRSELKLTHYQFRIDAKSGQDAPQWRARVQGKRKDLNGVIPLHPPEWHQGFLWAGFLERHVRWGKYNGREAIRPFPVIRGQALDKTEGPGL